MCRRRVYEARVYDGGYSGEPLELSPSPPSDALETSQESRSRVTFLANRLSCGSQVPLERTARAGVIAAAVLGEGAWRAPLASASDPDVAWARLRTVAESGDSRLAREDRVSAVDLVSFNRRASGWGTRAETRSASLESRAFCRSKASPRGTRTTRSRPASASSSASAARRHYERG